MQRSGLARSPPSVMAEKNVRTIFVKIAPSDV